MQSVVHPILPYWQFYLCKIRRTNVQDALGLEKYDKDIMEEKCNEETNSDFFLCSYNFDCW